MYKKLLVVLGFLLACLSLSFANAKDVCETCTSTEIHQKRPAVPNMVCWDIRQKQPDYVVFRLGHFLHSGSRR